MGEAALVAKSDPDRQTTEPIARVAGFIKRYRKIVAVRGIDLDVLRGEIYGLIGPDAAGKSSLMKACQDHKKILRQRKLLQLPNL